MANQVMSQSFTATGLIAGNVYYFKISAHNALGYGPQSSAFGIMAATVPGIPSAPTTSIIGTNLVITWSLP